MDAFSSWGYMVVTSVRGMWIAAVAWSYYDVYNTYGARPVFYLTKNVTALGAGSLEDPFIIEN